MTTFSHMNIVAGKGHSCLLASGICKLLITLLLACINESNLSLIPMTVLMKKKHPWGNRKVVLCWSILSVSIW